MSQELVIREELKKETNNAITTANAMVITDNATNEVATNFLKAVKKLQKDIDAELSPAIEKAFDLHRSLVDQKKRFLAPLQAAEQTVKNKVSSFLVEQERIRQEEQRKEREKAEAAERKRKEELEEQAKRHEANGRTEKAEERRAMAEEVHIPVPIVESKLEQQKGVSTKTNWNFEVTDESLIPRDYLMVDVKAIGQVVRALKDKAKAEKMIPGIRVWSETGIAVRV